MSKSNPTYGDSNHETERTQHRRGLNPDHGPDLPARQFQSLLAAQPKRDTVLR